MRIRSLFVEHFRCIGAARLSFGPGLNVLYGPNDLGKSSIAEALRAALLLPSASTEHKGFVPAGTDNVPKVVMEFDLAEGAGVWRVTKTFGVGARATATLETSKGAATWHTDARGRDVDGRLRDLLSWGIPAPGGKGVPRGMAQTFLTTALLGRQGEVDAILTASLEKDPDASGRQIVTQALNVLGQDPIVRRLLTRLEDKTDEVFDNRGRQRRAEDSPLVRAKHEIESREGKIKALEETARRSDEVQRAIRERIKDRDRIAGERDAAVAGLGEARRELERGELRRAAEKRLATAQADLERALAVHQAVADARRTLTESEVALTDVSERSRVADEALGAQEVEARRTRDALETARRIHGETLAAAEHAREKRVSDLRADLAATLIRATAARDAGALEDRAISLRGELAEAEVAFEKSVREAARADAVLRLTEIYGEHRKAVQALDALREAERWREAGKSAFEAAVNAVDAAEAAVTVAQHRVDEDREAVRREQTEDAARGARRQAITTSLMQVESSQRDAIAIADRARATVQRGERVKQLEQSFDAASARASVVERQLAESSASIELAQQELRELGALVLWLRAESLARQREGHDAPTRVADLRARASDARTRAAELESSSFALPVLDRLPQLRSIDERKRSLRAPINSEPTRVPIALATAAALGSGLSIALLFRMLTTVDGVVVAFAGVLAATIAGVLCVTLLGRRGASVAAAARRGQEAEHEYVTRRWAEDVEPLLRAAGVADVDALERCCREAEERRARASSLKGDAERLEAQATLAERDVDTLAVLRREEDGLRNQLVGHDLDAIEKRATALRSPGGDGVDVMLRQAEGALSGQKKSRELLLENRAHSTVQLESARAFLEAARAEVVPHAGDEGAESRVALDEAERRIQGARDKAEELRRQLDSLEAPLSDAASSLPPTKEADDALAAAIADLKAKGTLREQAARELAEAETRHAVCVRDAVAYGLPSLERHLADARQTLGEEEGDGGDSSDALRARDQRKGEADAAGTRLAGLRARCDEASRAFDQAQAALAGPWASLLAEAESTAARAKADLEAGASGPQDQVDAAARELATAEALHAAAEAKHAAAGALAQELAAKRDVERTTRDRARGQLEERERLASGVDLAGAEVALVSAQSAKAALPDAPVAEGTPLEAQQGTVDRLEKELRRVEDELRENRGRLEVVGGAMAQESLQEEREALARLTEKTMELELDYAASRLLLDTLKEAEAKHAAHVGACLAHPVTERFKELTGGRYARVLLDPALSTRAVVASSDERAPETLSVGTREQLATLVRLALAAQLHTVVLLDDHLVQSDPLRLEWFRQRLRASVRDHAHQVIVFTCRSDDYLARGELPAAEEPQRETDAGFLVITNLERVIIRGASRGISSLGPRDAQ